MPAAGGLAADAQLAGNLGGVDADGKQLGGAPTNFAYVAGLLAGDADTVAVASRVGRDALGRAALDRLARAGVSTEYVQTDATHPTRWAR